MSRLMIPFALCPLLGAPVLVQSAEIEQTASFAVLKGPNLADCAQATSLFEQYELGCPMDQDGQPATAREPNRD